MNREYIVKLLSCISAKMAEKRDTLIEMDSVVGDGDLGLTMSDGFKAAYEAVAASEETDIGKLVYAGGKAMSTAVPSTMGTLMASGLMQIGKAFRGRTEIADADMADFFGAYLDGVANRGKAKVGDKTFMDGLAPAVDALKASFAAGDGLKDAAAKGAEAAKNGYLGTKGMLAIHGRAAGRGEASRELLDPGAAVAMFMLEAFNESVQ